MLRMLVKIVFKYVFMKMHFSHKLTLLLPSYLLLCPGSEPALGKIDK